MYLFIFFIIIFLLIYALFGLVPAVLATAFIIICILFIIAIALMNSHPTDTSSHIKEPIYRDPEEVFGRDWPWM